MMPGVPRGAAGFPADRDERMACLRRRLDDINPMARHPHLLRTDKF